MASAPNPKRVRVVVSQISDREVPYLPHVAPVNPRQTLDIYVPGSVKATDAVPIIFFLHGGALTMGDKSKDRHVAKAFTAHGYIVVIPNYRLTPEVSHPEHARDAAAALEWVHTNADEYGGDIDDVTVVGFSAGAYLASLITFDHDTYFDADEEPYLRRLVLMSGFYHVDRIAPTRDLRIWGRRDADWKKASPIEYVSGGAPLPPTLILYGDRDTKDRQQESEDLALKMVYHSENSVEVTEIANRTHVQLWRKMAAKDDDAVQAILAWLR